MWKVIPPYMCGLCRNNFLILGFLLLQIKDDTTLSSFVKNVFVGKHGILWERNSFHIFIVLPYIYIKTKHCYCPVRSSQRWLLLCSSSLLAVIMDHQCFFSCASFYSLFPFPSILWLRKYGCLFILKRKVKLFNVSSPDKPSKKLPFLSSIFS